MTDARPALKRLYHYPVKGLSAQPLEAATLRAGQPFPFDRSFALARPGAPMAADAPAWAKKGLFVMLMLEEALAKVQTHLDPDTLRLTIRAGPEVLLSVDLTDAAARARVEAFFQELVPTLPAPPTLVRARDGHFMDKPENVISLINLATLRALEQEWGRPIDPLRFRANLYVDTGAAWEEFDWVGSDIAVGDCAFHVDRRNGRCGATNVDPATGARDMDIPRALRTRFGHKDLGVYLMVTKGGTLAVGDALTRPRAPAPVAIDTPVAAVSTGRQFICRGCYFIYCEADGWPADGVAGTPCAQLPDSWRCPDCGTDRSKLRPHVV